MKSWPSVRAGAAARDSTGIIDDQRREREREILKTDERKRISPIRGFRRTNGDIGCAGGDRSKSILFAAIVYVCARVLPGSSRKGKILIVSNG